MNREFFIKEFIDTLKIKYTKKSIIYKENYNFTNYYKNLIIVWSENTVSTILKISNNKHIAALNFADPYQPGGLVKYGVRTQEECLCQSSTLYRALNTKDNIKNFYEYNFKKGHTTDRIIYSPKVLFFKDDKCNRIKNVKWCDIITCSAPFKEEELTSKEIQNRMKRIILSAFENNVNILILGKWGCGAFDNNWNIFKKLWENVLQEFNIK